MSTNVSIYRGMMPQTYEQAIDFARRLAETDLVPKSYQRRPDAILVAIQWGAELGLAPMTALQCIAVVNGRPTIYGDAALALVRRSPLCVSVREGVDGADDQRHGWCEVIRRGEEPQRRTFSVSDAKRAGLWGKTGPWQSYPDRMLQLRARGFALRDVFPDLLSGLVTYEEAQDYSDIPPARGPVVDSTSSPPPQQAVTTPEPDLVVLKPDGEPWHAPSVDHWQRAALRAVSMHGDVDSLLRWQQAMQPYIEAAPDQARAMVLEAIEQRMTLLRSE